MMVNLSLFCFLNSICFKKSRFIMRKNTLEIEKIFKLK